MANRTALHEDDRMMTVFAGYRRGQTGDKLRLGSSGHEFEAAGRQMVAFINNQVPIAPDSIVHHAFANQTLDQGNVYDPSQFSASASKSS